MKAGTIPGVALLLATIVTVAAAQAQRWQPIAYGETLAGFLTVGDDSLQDGSLFKLFLFEGQESDSITIQLNSEDFTAHVLFANERDDVLATDDNSNGQCNALIKWVLEESGRYVIYANAVSRGETGQFQVTLTKGTKPRASPRPCAGYFDPEGILAVGDTTVGLLDDQRTLSDSTHYQVWLLTIPLGQEVTIDLVADEFDPTLVLFQGFAKGVQTDDDGAGGCNARLVLTADERSYRLLVRASKPGETGNYKLSMVNGALPKVEESLCEAS